jgi:hypothetical protein
MPLKPAKDDPTVLQAPKNLPNATIQIPQRDADGNPIGGIRLPDIAVPLGVTGAQNQPLSFSCSLVGAFLPFPTTNDPANKQPSLQQRYKDNNDYLNRVRIAARDAQVAGFLLPEDATVIVNDAASHPIFGRTSPDVPR